MPTFHKLDRTPTTFSQFTSLPPELQLLIWDHAIIKPWEASEAWLARNSPSKLYQGDAQTGLLRQFKQLSTPCCYHCSHLYFASHELSGRSGAVAYFHGTSYEERARYMMFDALSVSRMTRLFVLRWWKRTIDGEETSVEDLDRKEEVVTVLGELINEVESRINN